MTTSILVVDDDKDYRDIIKSILEMDDYYVLEASSGFEALAIVKKTPVDLILTDIRMPDGSGIELLKEVRAQDDRFPPIIMISGYSVKGKEELLQSGADAVLEKPVPMDDLQEHIRTALAK